MRLRPGRRSRYVDQVSLVSTAREGGRCRYVDQVSLVSTAREGGRCRYGEQVALVRRQTSALEFAHVCQPSKATRAPP